MGGDTRRSKPKQAQHDIDFTKFVSRQAQALIEECEDFCEVASGKHPCL